mmetsp:Transcript_4076/g.12953  ORF Transcript_4076/g.12953 Transcript_4076/m.12953 type:complete len:220 (-) Transcript_4076:246-905(-)
MILSLSVSAKAIHSSSSSSSSPKKWKMDSHGTSSVTNLGGPFLPLGLSFLLLTSTVRFLPSFHSMVVPCDLDTTVSSDWRVSENFFVSVLLEKKGFSANSKTMVKPSPSPSALSSLRMSVTYLSASASRSVMNSSMMTWCWSASSQKESMPFTDVSGVPSSVTPASLCSSSKPCWTSSSVGSSAPLRIFLRRSANGTIALWYSRSAASTSFDISTFIFL